MLLYVEGGRVSAILWWDYSDTSQHLVSVGSGGYRDHDKEETENRRNSSVEI